MQPNLPTPEISEELALLIDRAVVLEREIDERQKELKTIKAKIEAFALTQPAEVLADNNREGRKVIMRGRTHQAQVVMESDLLIASFRDQSSTHQLLLGICDGDEAKLEVFFSKPDKWDTKYKDGHAFRKAAAAHLTPAQSAKFVAACRQVVKGGVTKSRSTVTFG
jgi:hypothetical protein